MRRSLENLIRSVGLRVAAFASAQEFLRSDRPEVPGCLVLDVRLPGLSGLDLQRRMAEADLDIPIVFITGHGDIPMSVRAMKDGAVEFLTKPFRDQDLLDAVHQALERARAASAQRADIEALRARYRSLTPREREVMALVVAGLPNKQVGGKLGTSETTVKIQRHQVMEKLGPAPWPSSSGWRTGSASSPQSRSRLSQSVIEARIARRAPLVSSRPLPSLVLLRGALQMRIQRTWECSQRQAALSYWAGSRSTLACACCTSR